MVIVTVALAMAVTIMKEHLVAAQGSVTWSGQIASLVYGNCTTCHHPGGGPVQPVDLPGRAAVGATDGDRHLVALHAAVVAGAWIRRLRRWRELHNEQIALIAKWVAAGMPEGDASAAPRLPVYSETWQYGTPDLILTVERPFALAASGSDVFRNFVLPYPLQQTHYIRAMEIRPVVPRIVHHANILIDRTASFRRAHPEEWKDGVPGMELEVDTGNDFDPDSNFLFWKPDTPVLIEPEGMPWRLDPGNDLILNMHLMPSGKPEIASAQVGLYFTDQPPSKQPMLLQLEHDSALDIPASSATSWSRTDCGFRWNVEVLGIYPHAHYLGKRMEAWATLPDQQKRWLILIPSWDIDRQSVYRYRKPVFSAQGLSRAHALYLRQLFQQCAQPS